MKSSFFYRRDAGYGELMSKKNKTPLEIFAEALKLYFSNFDKFIKYMTFPVLGQILGLVIVFSLTFYYSKNLPNLIDKLPNFAEPSTVLIFALLISLPGLAIFVKAFWEYLVAYGAVNSMVENMVKSGKLYDFDAHTELIKRRTIPFMGLWILFSIFSLVALIPFFWVPCAVFAIYFVLVFQVFTYEPDLSPIGCVKKSLQLIKGSFWSTLLLFALVGALTYVLIPQIIDMFCSYTHINLALANLVKPIVISLPLDSWNSVLSYIYLPALKVDEVALFVVSIFVAQIFIQYTLPLRTILWALWYRRLNGALPKQVETTKKNKNKKPSEKLMENSNKKFTSKKLDKNILKRAMEKD